MRRLIFAAAVTAASLLAGYGQAFAQTVPFTIYAPSPAPEPADPLRGTYPYGPRVYGYSYYRYSPEIYGYRVRGYRHAPGAYRYYRAAGDCGAYLWDRCNEPRRYRRHR